MRATGVGAPAMALPLVSCLTLDNLLTFPESQFSHLQDGPDSIVCVVITHIKLDNACKVLSSY